MKGADYRIEVKVRNANILSSLADIGYTPTSLAKSLGLNIGNMCGLAAMKISPLLKNGEMRREAEAICTATGRMLCELYTPEQMEGFERTSFEADVSHEEMERLVQGSGSDNAIGWAASSGSDDPLLLMEAEEDLQRLQRAMERLPDRTRSILEDRSDGKKLREIAVKHGVTACRIREIEIKGRRVARGLMLRGKV